jgi:arylformamidase
MPSPRGKRFLVLIGLALALWLLWFWPARRNYYFKRDLVVRHLDIPYTAATADPRRQLDLYQPHPPPVPDTALAPVVVFVHGGYWTPLDRRWLQSLTGAQYPRVQRADDSLDDIAAAIRFVRDSCPSWGCDSGRIFVVGHSAGGHLASLLAMDGRILRRNGVDPEAIRGFVSIDGIFDIRASLAEFKPAQADIVRRLFGPDEARLTAHSTISYARPRHPPLLFVDPSSASAPNTTS